MGLLEVVTISAGFFLIAVHYLVLEQGDKQGRLKVELFLKRQLDRLKQLNGYELAKEDAKFFVKGFKRRLGLPLSIKGMVRIGAASFVFTALYVSSLFLYYEPHNHGNEGAIFEYDMIASILINALGNSIWDWVSYFITFLFILNLYKYLLLVNRGSLQSKILKLNKLDLFLFKILPSKSRALYVSGVLVLDIVIVLLISILSMQTIFVFFDIYYYSMYGEIKYVPGFIEYSNVIQKIINTIAELNCLPPPYWEQGSLRPLTYLIMLTAALPTILHLFLMIIFLLPRLLPGPIFKPLERVFVVYINAPGGAILFLGAGLIATSQLVSAWKNYLS